MDEVVWTEVIRLLEEPALIQQELDRRLAAAQAADPTKKRTQAVERDLARVGKSMERLLTAYQEDLLSLEQLRERMPLLRQREQTLRDELNALVEQTRERAAHLRLAETLSAFLTRLRAAAETLDIVERQRIVRLVVKEVLVNDDTIVIRHCIPVPSGPPPTNDGGPNNDTDNAADPRSYLLRSGSSDAPLGRPRRARPWHDPPSPRPPSACPNRSAAGGATAWERYAFPRIVRRPVSEVNTADVLEILTPIWHVKAETARAVRQRIRSVLEWAISMDRRNDKPCDRVLPVLSPQNDSVTHRRALPHKDIAAAIESVRDSNSAQPAVRLAFEFLGLTAARSGDGAARVQHVVTRAV